MSRDPRRVVRNQAQNQKEPQECAPCSPFLDPLHPGVHSISVCCDRCGSDGLMLRCVVLVAGDHRSTPVLLVAHFDAGISLRCTVAVWVLPFLFNVRVTVDPGFSCDSTVRRSSALLMETLLNFVITSPCCNPA